MTLAAKTIGSAFGAFLLIFIGVYFFFFKPLPAPEQPTQSPAALPSGETTDPSGTTKTYTHIVLGYQISYPSSYYCRTDVEFDFTVSEDIHIICRPDAEQAAIESYLVIEGSGGNVRIYVENQPAGELAASYRAEVPTEEDKAKGILGFESETTRILDGKTVGEFQFGSNYGGPYTLLLMPLDADSSLVIDFGTRNAEHEAIISTFKLKK